jgi:hypothetical protein
MVQDPQTLYRRHGLTYVESSELGLRRRRCGKGFSYLDPSGTTVRDKAVKARIKALAIPPAWTHVCIAQDDRAHIQAIGRDAEGRLQYRAIVGLRVEQVLNFGVLLGEDDEAWRGFERQAGGGIGLPGKTEKGEDADCGVGSQ